MKKSKITISEKDYDNILGAWAKTNTLCTYVDNPEIFTKKFSLKERLSEIYKHLDKVVTNLPD
jgi:hypothetical protein